MLWHLGIRGLMRISCQIASWCKNTAGLFPVFELLFNLPADSVPVSVQCEINNCCRLNQDNYQIGLLFREISLIDEARINQYLGKLSQTDPDC